MLIQLRNWCLEWRCLTREASGTTAGEFVDLVHTHAFIQTGGGDTLVHLRLTQRAWDKQEGESQTEIEDKHHGGRQYSAWLRFVQILLDNVYTSC